MLVDSKRTVSSMLVIRRGSRALICGFCYLGFGMMPLKGVESGEFPSFTSNALYLGSAQGGGVGL